MDFYQQLFMEIVRNSTVLVVFGALLIILQWLYPAYKEQKNFTKSTANDLAYSYILTVITPFFIAIPVAMANTMLSWGIGLEKISGMISADMSLPVQVFIAVFFVDFVSYWRHRIMHMKYLWPMHAIHHCSTKLTWLSTERFHVFNYIISTFVSVITVAIFLGPAAAFYGSLLRRFYNFFIHTNVRIDYGPLNYLIVSPRFHHWHHSRDPRAINCNYTTFFSFIDLIFGSYYLPKDKSFPSDLGENDHIPESLVSQFVYPMKAWEKMFRERRVVVD